MNKSSRTNTMKNISSLAAFVNARSNTICSEQAHQRKSWSNNLIIAFALLGLSSQIHAQAVGIAPPAATQLPTNGQIVSGAATITQSGANMDINQTTQRGVIDWQTFDVGSQATVNF